MTKLSRLWFKLLIYTNLHCIVQQLCLYLVQYKYLIVHNIITRHHVIALISVESAHYLFSLILFLFDNGYR